MDRSADKLDENRTIDKIVGFPKALAEPYSDLTLGGILIPINFPNET